jgi:hypothetical protein
VSQTSRSLILFQKKLPAAPSAPCSQALQNKINIVLDRMEKYNYSINDDIYRKKSFKNPSIYEKLILDIDEHGSSFPTVRNYFFLFPIIFL